MKEMGQRKPKGFKGQRWWKADKGGRKRWLVVQAELVFGNQVQMGGKIRRKEREPVLSFGDDNTCFLGLFHVYAPLGICGLISPVQELTY